ncbi:MAG: ATP-binding cassette domain-containing protein, partial [Gammaproteobacteria bacterium]
MSKQELLTGTINSLLSTGSDESCIKTTNIHKENKHMSERAGVSINLKEVTHRYNAKSPLTFEKLDMQSEPGESLVIIGRSGCGKSTLLHIVAGLLGGFNGTVEINGKAVKKESSKWIMMFQA